MIHIIHLEDDPVDSQLARELLEEAGMSVELDRIYTLSAFETALTRRPLHLIISDYTIPGVDPLETLRLARERRPEVPYIFLSGTIGEEAAIETLKSGATDYVLKEHIARLAPTIRRALQEAQDQARRKEGEIALKQAHDALARANQELERKVQERTAQLAEANANLQTFVYTAAHDLRSPLRAIRNFSGIVLEDYGAKLDPEVRSLLERVSGAADHMAVLLNDLLEYNRVSQGEVKLQSVPLAKVVSDALALLEVEVKSTQAEIQVPEELPSVMAHPATLVLIVHNFLSNALKFVASGVRPRIEIRAESGGTSPGGQDRVRVSFQDNGIGIAASDLPKLFNVFQRLHGKSVYSGTGLGLAIVRKGAERMGGCVGVESELGKGSCFWLELNAAPG